MRVDELLPHAGNSRLIRRIIGWDERRIECEGRPPADPDHPLRCNGRVEAVAAVEYGAQAMAIHGTLGAGGERPRLGFLVSVHDLTLVLEHLDDIEAPLRVNAECVLTMGERVSYEFTVSSGSAPIASGRANVSLRGELPE